MKRFLLMIAVFFCLIGCCLNAQDYNLFDESQLSYGDGDNALKIANELWEMLPEETKEKMKKEAVELGAKGTSVGMSLTSSALKYAFGDPKAERAEEETMENLEFKELRYFSNLNNTGKPGIVISFVSCKETSIVKVDLFGESFDCNDVVATLSKEIPIILCPMEEGLKSFPEDVKVEISGSLTKIKKTWNKTIDKAF